MIEFENPATIALHADHEFRTDRSVSPPICQSVTYLADGQRKFAESAQEPFNGEFYGRHGNPTSNRLAKVVADLEGAETGLVLSSGMGAITTTLLSLVKQGDHVIAQDNHYSATASFLKTFLPRFGVDTTFANQTDPTAFKHAIRPNTKVIFVESPVNPKGSITDLAAIAGMARPRGIYTLCDNTFASPINQRPIDLGIDLSVHSMTKYIGGHHDLLSGIVLGSRSLLEQVWQVSMDLGPIGAPFDAWLALRGVRTLQARVAIHNVSAMRIAEYLSAHPAIQRVHYAGLSSHPQHELAARQMSGFGGMLSFELNGGFDAAAKFVSRTQICLNAASLGGVETLIVQPAAMFQARLSSQEIQSQGVSEGMIRMSVGIENVEDIIADIEQALNGL